MDKKATPPHGEKSTKLKEDGTTQEVFKIEFTNGGIKQLENLQKFFKADDLTAVVQLGIGYLQRIKEAREQVKKEGGE
jgi:ribosome maturation protein Sdo1